MIPSLNGVAEVSSANAAARLSAHGSMLLTPSMPAIVAQPNVRDAAVWPFT